MIKNLVNSRQDQERRPLRTVRRSLTVFWTPMIKSTLSFSKG